MGLFLPCFSMAAKLGVVQPRARFVLKEVNKKSFTVGLMQI